MLKEATKPRVEFLLDRNPPPMSKAEEKNLYRQFILATPEDSYLRGVLVGSRDFIFNNIDCDVVWPVYEQVRQTDKWIRELEARRKKVATDLHELEERKRKLVNEIKYLESDRNQCLLKTREFLDSISEESNAIHRRLKEVS